MRYLKVLGWTLLAALYLLVAATVAQAATGDAGSAGNGFELKAWAAVAAVFSPIVAYLLNRFLPSASQGARSAILAGAAAIAGAIAELVERGTIGLDDPTLEYIGSALLAAFAAHAWLWSRNNVAARLAYRTTDPA